MASKYRKKFDLPEGFYDVLENYSREVLRDQPLDIIEFSYLYFKALEEVSCDMAWRDIETENLNIDHLIKHCRAFESCLRFYRLTVSLQTELTKDVCSGHDRNPFLLTFNFYFPLMSRAQSTNLTILRRARTFLPLSTMPLLRKR